jgi:hypothetical protein
MINLRFKGVDEWLIGGELTKMKQLKFEKKEFFLKSALFFLVGDKLFDVLIIWRETSV